MNKSDKRIGRSQKEAKSRSSALPYVSLGRVSRVGDRGDRLRSPDQQKATNEAFAGREGLTIDEHVILIDVSGSKIDEERELERVIRRVEAGEVAGVIVPKLDRLSRLPARRRIELEERIGPANILSATEPNDVETPEGRFIRDVFFALARMEWSKKKQDLDLAKSNAIAAGRAIKSREPLGYRFDDSHRLIVEETEAELVRELFELRAAGRSWGDLLDRFEQRTGRRSHRQSMRAIILNRTYLGELHYGQREDTRLVRLEAHEAIVELDLFERAAAVTEERSGLGPGLGHHYGAPSSELSSIARCQGCGRGLTRSSSGGGRNRVIYKCPSDSQRCRARASIGLEELEAYVEAEVLAWAGATADQVVEVELETSQDRAGAEYRLAEAERVALEYETDVELELEVGAEAYAGGRKARARLVERRRQELAALGEASELELLRGTVREVLEEGTIEEKRRLLGRILAGVIVRKTPRRGAPAAERAEILFAPSTSGAIEQDRPELLEEAAA